MLTNDFYTAQHIWNSSTIVKYCLLLISRLKNGKLELDFESDNADIRNPEAHEVDLTSVYHRTSHVETSEYVQSLRVSASVKVITQFCNEF